jgi:uracil-DNA glycosylase
MTAHVRAWKTQLPSVLPLPHPSWRTGHWERSNPWFGAEILPALRARVGEVLA